MNWIKKRLYYRRRKRISDLIYSKDLIKDVDQGYYDSWSAVYITQEECDRLAEEILQKLGLHKPTKQKL